MNKRQAEKWCRALESGKYNQGTSFLYRKETNSYCCLGVLCKINNIKHKKKEQHLPKEAREKFNLECSEGSLENVELFKINGSEYGSLAEANDSGESFKDIAKWIKKNYKRLN